MREALSVIASAWSVAFIWLLIVALLIPDDHSEARTQVISVLFVCAVTGAGWLWYRHVLKQQRKP